MEGEERIAGRYLLEEELGRGGTGVVHATLDEQTNRRIAIKRLSREAAVRPYMVSLFEREFHALKSLAHPNIVAAIDYGVDGVPFYTMELLSGGTVAGLAPMPWKRACSVLRDVAVALSLVHSRRLVHRDVTCGNIHCDDEGHIKLIDFGGLAPIGVCRKLVGTPPYIAPEVLNQLSLDQRTDLYSLGAAAYYLVTGRHAYPARSTQFLRTLWRSRPLPLAARADAPDELDDLVMSLLDLNPGARPPNAGIVVARLTAIAGLPRVAAEATARAFLTSPRLVGRDNIVKELQRRAVRLRERSGSLILLRSLPGMGRSRLLDSIALEAQVLGIPTLRVDSRDGGSEAALRRSLERGLPQSAAGPENSPEPVTGDDALASFAKRIRKAMHDKGLVVLIDDLERFEPTAVALVLRLARMTATHPLLLIATRTSQVPNATADALQILGDLGKNIELGPLTENDTRELVASCFDGASNLRSAATFCHALSAGRPQTIVALAQHLVDEDIARLEDGSWQLPASLEGYDLPASAEDFLAERIERLDPDARLLGQLLSLIHPATTLTVAHIVELMSGRMRAERSHGAIETLSAEQLAVENAGVVQVRQEQVRAAFEASMNNTLSSALHLALATKLESFEDYSSTCAAAHHMLKAGRPDDCVRLMRKYSIRVIAEVSEEELAQRMLPFGHWGESFEAALDYAEQQRLSPHELYPLYHAMITMAALNEPRWLPRGKRLFDHLVRDVGLDFYRAAELEALAQGARPRKLTTLWRLARAWLRHLRTPRQERGLAPTKALELLGLYTTAALGVANATQTFHREVPLLAQALAPFRGLSPALALLFELMVGSADAGRGLASGWQRLQGLMKRLRTKVPGMPDIYRVTALNIVQYLEALECRAPLGDPTCLEVADDLARDSGFRTHAWQLRMLYYIYVGDDVSAERCRQEVEARSLNSARDDLSIVSGSKDVAQAQALSGNASGLQRTVQSLETTVRRFSHWRGQLLVYRGECARLVGDFQAAKDHLVEALAFAEAGTNYSWAKAVPPYLDVLLRLSEVDEAQRAARDALADVERVGIAPVYRRQIEAAAALVWATSGQHERARRDFERLLAEAEAAGVRGITLAALEEARARAALTAGDAKAFVHAARGVARLFANHDNPALIHRYQRLLDEAERAGIKVDADGAGLPGYQRDPLNELRKRVDHPETSVRLRRALQLLVEQCQAQDGYLFLVRDGAPECVASAGVTLTATTGLDQFVRSLASFSTELTTGLTVTDVHRGAAAAAGLSVWTSPSGATYDPIPLLDAAGHIVGVTLLQPALGTHIKAPSRAFVLALVTVLSEMDCWSHSEAATTARR